MLQKKIKIQLVRQNMHLLLQSIFEDITYNIFS